MKKLMSILSAMLFVSVILTSCGGVDACSCLSDAEALAKEITEAGSDVDALEGLNADLQELNDKCTEAAKDDAEAWAKAMQDC